MLKSKPYERIMPKDDLDITEYYTAEQIAVKYKVNPKWVWTYTREHNIPKIKIRQFNYYSKGWITAAQVRTANIHQVNNDCMEIIRSMSSWSWEDYKAALIRKGYSVHERRDKDNYLRGYTLQKGNAWYKASELGVARNLKVTKLQRTWEKEHIGNNKVNSVS